MRRTGKMLSVTVIALSMLGCEDKPHEYGQSRPPIDQIDSEGEGLQSKDLMQQADQMAMSLLKLPALNASDTKWTIVAQAMENQTVSQRQSLDIFVDAVKSRLYAQGGDRISLIENRDRYHDLQARELEGAQQEGAQVPAGIQPQFVLYGKMQELPNRGTSTYRAEFNLTNFKTREIVWTDEHIVKVRR